MSRAQGHVPVQVFGDRADHTQLKARHRRAARGMAAHFFCGASCCRSFVLVLGLLQRDAKVPKDCVIHGVPTRSLGTDGPRLRHRTCPNKSQSVPIQSSGLLRALLNVGAHIHVLPLRKAASYSFIIRVPAVEEQFPVGPTKGDAAAQFSSSLSHPNDSQSAPDRLRIWLVQFPVCSSSVQHRCFVSDGSWPIR
jgi:hypothetical protein